MPEEQRFYRSVFEVELLSDEPLPEHMQLSEIDEVGHSSGVMTKVSEQQVVVYRR